MLQQEAIALASAKEGYVPVKIIAGTINTKNRVETYWSLPEDQLDTGNVIEFLGTEWAIKIVNFRAGYQPTIFVVPLE